MSSRHIIQRYIPPAQCISSGDLTGTITGSSFDVSGFNHMTIYIEVTDANSSTTALPFYLEASPDDGTTWFRFTAGALSAAATEALQNHEYSADPSDAATSTGKKFVIERPINVRGFTAGLCRFVTSAAGTGSGSGDLLDVSVTLGVV